MLACLDLEQKNQEEGDVGEKEMEVALKRSSGLLCTMRECAPTEVLGWSERECACIRACISACCMLLLAVNGFCGVCVSAALLSTYLCLLHVCVLPACSVEQKKKQRGALHHRRRESMKET